MAFPRVTDLGSVSSSTPGTATLSLGIVSAQAGDQIIVQIVQKHPNGSFTIQDPSVSWGTATIAAIGPGFNYGTALAHIVPCGTVSHRVLASQSAEMTFTFSGRKPKTSTSKLPI